MTGGRAATMRRPNQVAGLALLAFAAFVIHGALELRYYTSLGPGPGFFSFWLGAALAILAVLMIGQATLGAEEDAPPGFLPDREGARQVGGVVAALAATAFLLRPLGFCITMLAVHLFLLRIVGRAGWTVSLAGAALGSFGAFYLFDDLLRVPLPEGPFGF